MKLEACDLDSATIVFTSQVLEFVRGYCYRAVWRNDATENRRLARRPWIYLQPLQAVSTSGQFHLSQQDISTCSFSGSLAQSSCLHTKTEHGHIPTVLGHRRIYLIYLQATFISTQAQRHALHTVHRKAIHLPHNDGHTRSPIEHDAAQISTRHLPVAVPTPALHNSHTCRPPMIHIYPSASARRLRMAIPRYKLAEYPMPRFAPWPHALSIQQGRRFCSRGRG